MSENTEIYCTEEGCTRLADWTYIGGAMCSQHQSTVLNRMQAMGKIDTITEPNATVLFQPVWRPDPTDPHAPANWRAQIANAKEAATLADEARFHWEGQARKLDEQFQQTLIEVETLRAQVRSLEHRCAVMTDENAQLVTDLRGYREAKSKAS